MGIAVGARVRSQVCATEMVVVRWAGNGDLTCGGHLVVPVGEDVDGSLSLGSRNPVGNAIGKRYVDPAGEIEILVVKPGEGQLAYAGEALGIKQSKALPSSD